MQDWVTLYKHRIDEIFMANSDKTAICYLCDDGNRMNFSYSSLYNLIWSFEKVIKRHDLSQGDRVAIITQHSPFGIIAGVSLAYWNLTMVLIDNSLPDLEISRLIKKSDVRAILTVPERFQSLKQTDYEDIPVLELGTPDFSYPLLGTCCEFSQKDETPDPERDVIAILFSSGTTSEMKGIMTTYTSVLLAKDIFVDLSGLTPDMSYLLVLPFNHIAGFTGAFTYLLTGCTIGLLENVNASKLQSGLLNFEPSYFAMVPKVYEVMEQKIRLKFHEKGKVAVFLLNIMLKSSGFLRKNFGCRIGRKIFQPVLSEVFGKNIYGIGTGASPCPLKTAKFFLDMGIEWANLYASTETCVPITATGIHDCYPVGTVGNVNRHMGISVKIHNPDESGVGEIYVKSVLMMKGYFRDPLATQQAFDDGYFKTGDSGYIDKQGNLYVTGRIKESILLSTGKKVSPTDLDQIYQAVCPQGCIMASCGIPVKSTGYDEIHIFIEAQAMTEKEKEHLENEIIALSRTGSAIYSVKEVHFIPKMPLTAVGKVKRFKLKELVEEANGLDMKNKSSVESQTVRDIITDIIFQIKQRLPETLLDELELKEDLGFDSLSMFELCVAIETAMDIQIMNNLGDIKTFGELVELASGTDKANSSSKDYNIEDYPMKKGSGKKFILRLLMWLSWHLWKFEILGGENIPLNGNFILAPNHESHLDGLWVWTAIHMGIQNKTILNTVDFAKICCLAKEEHLDSSVSKLFMNLVGGIPVDRSGNTAPALRQCEECLKNGYYVLIHPEGTRTRNGEMNHFKKGAAEMAIRTRTNIIPVTISGAREIFNPENRLPRIFDRKKLSRYKLTISFGKAINPVEKNVCEITTELEKCVRGGRGVL